MHHRLEHAVDAVRADAVIHEESRGLPVWEEDAVGGEAHAVAHRDRGLPKALRVADGVGDDLLRGRGGADDLEEGHHVCGGEEVEADDAISCVGFFPDDVDVDGGGVGGEDARWLAHLLEVGEHLLLDANVLDDGLDDEVTLVEALVGGRRGQVAHAHLHGDRREPPAFEHARDNVGDPLDPRVERLVVDFLQDHVVSFEEHQGHDSCSHGTPPKDSDGLDLPRLNALEPRNLRALPGGQEHVDERLGAGAGDQRSEGVHLCFEPFTSTMQHARLDRIQARGGVGGTLGLALGLDTCKLNGLLSFREAAEA
mmetsp:Transcript_26934/g.50282  ORF Transcript_26934/g.50282 Transcript_26934/m.50282 type:complete len:311 (+) Transcript_26934:803-1735(+)